MLRSHGPRREFQSTLSVRRATPVHVIAKVFLVISIHALREESDARTMCTPWPTRNFNPRSP